MIFLYDIIVVGGGHAGCEAARAAAQMGARTLLITMDMTNKLAQMSCNPAMGGIAKGQIIREIDALGGMSGIVTDRSAIHLECLTDPRALQCGVPGHSVTLKFSVEWRKYLSVLKIYTYGRKVCQL